MKLLKNLIWWLNVIIKLNLSDNNLKVADWAKGCSCVTDNFHFTYCRAHPAISHCSHLLLKCRVATNISHWLKVKSRWKKYIFVKKWILISFWIFEYCFYLLFLHFLWLCHILLFRFWIFSIPSGFQKVWIQIKPDILTGLIWVLTVCKGYQQI